jgi:hypothetical protein
MLRSCGFFVEDGGLYENIVNFQLAFLGVLKLYSQANFIYLVSSQNSNSSNLPLVFQAVHDDDSIALTAEKSDVDLLDT